MRDAFGGSFMIKLFLIFIVLYVGFIALALNYAKAFKVKNLVIDYIEKNELQTVANLNSRQQGELDSYIEEYIFGKTKYNVSDYNVCSASNYDSTTDYCNPLGILIKKKGTSTNTLGVYYEVNTYVSWSVPFLRSLLTITNSAKNGSTPFGVWKISGETRVVVKQ